MKAKSQESLPEFTWRPGAGVASDALGRLRTRFGRPAEPMGEAWFMSHERRMFRELEGDLTSICVQDLQRALIEIAGGTSSFGPQQEWHDWYHYLLAQLIPRAHESFVDSLLEGLITGFIAIYPNGVHKPPYPRFQADVLMTLGRCMMDSSCWSGSEIAIGTCLHRSDQNPACRWGWQDASGDFSASMFFCLKYLPAPLVNDWFKSVLTIGSAHWRAQVLVWLVGANDILCGRRQWPSEFHLDDYPSVDWEWSHCLRPDLATADESGATVVGSLLSEEAKQAVLETARSHFTEDVFLEWLDSIDKVSYLKSELADIPSSFERLYVSTSKGRLVVVP